MSTEKRRSFLDKILGRDSAKVIETAMADMEATLDKKGVDRKEYDAKKVKGVLEDTVTAINDAIAPLSENIPEDLAAKILALVMGSLGQITEPEIVEDVEAMAEGEEEEEEVPEQLMELAKSVTDLATESLEANKDMRELIPYFVTMAKAVESLTPLVEKAKQIGTLEKRIKTVEGKINLRPRAASTAKETETDKKDIESELKKGLDGNKTVLGVPVKG